MQKDEDIDRLFTEVENICLEEIENFLIKLLQ